MSSHVLEEIQGLLVLRDKLPSRCLPLLSAASLSWVGPSLPHKPIITIPGSSAWQLRPPAPGLAKSLCFYSVLPCPSTSVVFFPKSSHPTGGIHGWPAEVQALPQAGVSQKEVRPSPAQRGIWTKLSPVMEADMLSPVCVCVCV